jgi:predicted phosphoribosyltransferase
VQPLVLSIPRGGVVTGAVLAQELNAELDVVLSQKLRAPNQPELSIGAVTDDGFMFLDPAHENHHWMSDGYVAEERRHQLTEMARRQQLIRRVCVQATIADRSVIVVDDGIVTGSTMIAALQAIRPHKPREMIVAVPVIPANRLREVRQWCDDLVAVLCPPKFWAIGQFYDVFDEVSDHEVVHLLQECGCQAPEMASITLDADYEQIAV